MLNEVGNTFCTGKIAAAQCFTATVRPELTA